MSVLGSRVAPWHSVLWLHLQIGAGPAEAMIREKLQPMLPVLVYLANSKATQAGRPRFMVYSYSGIEVAKEDKVIAAVDVLDGIVQVGLLPQVRRSRLGHRRRWVLLILQKYEGREAAGLLIPCKPDKLLGVTNPHTPKEEGRPWRDSTSLAGGCPAWGRR